MNLFILQEGVVFWRKWNRPVYAGMGTEGYLQVRFWWGGKRRNVALHRLIWGLHYGEWPAGGLDHRDRDRLNNRIDNLRVATPGEQQQNRGVNRNNVTGFMGVYWDRTHRKYRAEIVVAGKRKRLGRFATAEAASAAYALAKAEFHPYAS